MRFLADACVPRQVVDRLHADGHDVIRAAAGVDDDVILAAAFEQQRVVITEDRDFGKLAVHEQSPHAGVLLLRMPESTTVFRAERVVVAIAQLGDQLSTRFVVVEADRLR